MDNSEVIHNCKGLQLVIHRVIHNFRVVIHIFEGVIHIVERRVPPGGGGWLPVSRRLLARMRFGWCKVIIGIGIWGRDEYNLPGWGGVDPDILAEG